MRDSLHEHVVYLENSIQDVRNRLTHPDLTPEAVEDLQLQLTLAESALAHYRQAYALELSASGSEPPPQPSDCDDSNATRESERGKKNRSRAGMVALTRGGRRISPTCLIRRARTSISANARANH